MKRSCALSLAILLLFAMIPGMGENAEAPREEEMTISPTMTVAEADRILRAFRGVGCYFAREDGVRIHVREGRAGKTIPPAAEGVYALRDGYLEILA